MGVALRHCDPFVSEKFRNLVQWYTRLAQAAGERVAVMPSSA